MTAARGARLIRTFRFASIGALGVALFALLWRPRLEASLPDQQLGADSSFTFRSVAAGAGAAQRVVANNVFASARRAPGRRYAPATDASAGPDAAAGDPGMVFDPGIVAADAPVVLGTVIDALGARALLAVPGADSLPKFYTAGERVGAYRVRKVEAGRVILDGPNGRVILQLKPNEARP